MHKENRKAKVAMRDDTNINVENSKNLGKPLIVSTKTGDLTLSAHIVSIHELPQDRFSQDQMSLYQCSF